MTNSYGLYRYDTQDIFRVVGRAGRAPTLQFVRKRDGFSNLTGEKLAEGQVIASVRHAIATLGIDTGFFIAIPSVAELRYHFYLEMTAPQSVDRDTLARTIDEALGNINTEYRDKRASGRLACPCAHALKPGAYGLVKQALVDGGAREAQFKLLFLQPDERLKSRFDALTWLATRALPDDGAQREFADQPVLLPLS